MCRTNPAMPTEARLPLLIGLLLMSQTVAACSSEPSPPPPDPTATVLVPSPTPAPALEITSLELLETGSPGEWDALGLVENRSETARGRLLIRLELLDSEGESIGEIAAVPVLDRLSAGAQTPFWTRFGFPDGPPPASLRARVTARPVADLPIPDLTIELDQQFVTAAGGRALLGTVTNNERSPVQLSGFGLLALGPDSRPLALAALHAGPTVLAAGESVPYLAVALADPGRVEWRPYAGGAIAEMPVSSPVESFAPAELRFTPQGAPFVIGELENAGTAAQQVHMLFALRSDGRLLTLGAIELPIPLEPGDRLGYTATDFLGAGLRGADPQAQDLTVELRLESKPTATRTFQLTTEVEVFLPVGSGLFVRGGVTNQHSLTVEAASVLAEVRRVDGELWTAGWTQLQGPLEPGQAREFVLELPLSEELDLATLELDLRAYGTRAGE